MSRIPAAKLFDRRSPKTGRAYLSGRLGGLRVIVLENPERERDGAKFILAFEAWPERGEEPGDPTLVNEVRR